MIARLLFYGFIKPLSWLPLPVLYLLSDLIYGFSFLGWSYRKNVVQSNLIKAFPAKSTKERASIEKQFYRYFYDVLMESVRLFSMSKSEALQRFRVVNPDILASLANSGQSAILVGGHYTNWELFAVATDPQIPHQLLGIYTPLTNPFMERVFSASRSQFGLKLVPKRRIKETLDSKKSDLTLTTFAIDQCPRKDQKVYWMTFLGQPTAVHFGAEKYAREYEYPVIYGSSKLVKRGYYQLTLELLVENPNATEEGEITEAHTRRLEKQIIENPAYWLWTHKRWKLKPE
jgi:KDO2-lipid IV(A) lauroyltransferase